MATRHKGLYLIYGVSAPGSLLVGELPFRIGLRSVTDYGLVQHLAALVQGTLDDAPGLVHDTLHRPSSLVDGLLEHAAGLLRHLSYGLVRRLPETCPTACPAASPTRWVASPTPSV